MSTPGISYVTYASHPTKDGPVDLCAKIFRPETAEGPLPLLIWFHSGGFRSGDIESGGHDRVARLMMRHGYACAYVQYRFKSRDKDLTPAARDLLPALIADADLKSSDINRDFIGAPAIAAMEDGAAFLKWADENQEEQGFNGHYILGGSSAGAMTVLNLLHLAPQLGHEIPPIPTAIILSGAFAYPSYFQPTDTRILAIHGTAEPQMPATSIRGYAYMSPGNCVLLEHADHYHGDPRITREEPLRRGVRRFVEFDRGAALESARVDRPKFKPKHKSRICIFTCVRNEGPFLLEWIAHNRAIGVTDFVVFSNDCDDGTTELLDALDKLGVVKHVPNPSVALGSDQHLGLAVHCAQYTKAFRQSDYAILTDVDEFIQINVADGTLNGLLAVTGHPDVISLSELLYGFGGVETYENRLITSQFRVSDALEPTDGNARRGVKSIMRIGRDVAAYSNHRPQLKPDSIDGIHWVDGAGQPVQEKFITQGKRGLDVQGRYAMARVNHYTLRSGESMLVKFERGDAVRPGRMREKYFKDRNGRDIRNDDFLPFLPGIKAELGKLLKEPAILQLHKITVARHKAKITALKSNPDFADVWLAIQEELKEPIRSEAMKPAAE